MSTPKPPLFCRVEDVESDIVPVLIGVDSRRWRVVEHVDGIEVYRVYGWPAVAIEPEAGMIGMQRLMRRVVPSADLLSLTVEPRARVCIGTAFSAGNDSLNTLSWDAFIINGTTDYY